MIKTIKLENYRGFESLSMNNLGRVNLLVGKNNSGKTSILEALYLLGSGSNLGALWHVVARRGEQFMPDTGSGQAVSPEADISHLFKGHNLIVGAQFSISSENSRKKELRYKIDTSRNNQQIQNIQNYEGDLINSGMSLFIDFGNSAKKIELPLSSSGNIRLNFIQQVFINHRNLGSRPTNTQFITTDSLSQQQITKMWGSIVLTPEEDRITKALNILEPKIERIAQVQGNNLPIMGGMPNISRGGFFLKLSDTDKRIPIGSFGDGLWRIFAIAVALVKAKDGLLLIDEIDTGLHYSALESMWKLVYEAAKIFNVQVFATTHSSDCVRSLAGICDPNHSDDDLVTIHRIEKDKEFSVPFSEDEIKMVAENSIEIR